MIEQLMIDNLINTTLKHSIMNNNNYTLACTMDKLNTGIVCHYIIYHNLSFIYN